MRRTTRRHWPRPQIANTRSPVQVRKIGRQCQVFSEMTDAGARQKAPNTKLQAPKKHQVPNTKHQAPNSREAPSSKRGPRFGGWNLGFLWCLELGVWCFDSGISPELGVWRLVFRSEAARKQRCAPHTLA